MILGTHRRSLKMIKSEPFPLIENAIAEEFKYKCFNCSKEPMINSNGNDAKADASVSESEEVIEVDEDITLNTLSVITPNETTCPTMHHFNMPFDNEQCINNILVESFSNKKHKEDFFSTYKNNKETMHSRVPKGASRSQL